VERYVDLGSCYDTAALWPLREEIMACMTGYPACYARAYRCLDAAGELREDSRAALLTPALKEKLTRRAQGILRRELKPLHTGEKGRVKQRFLTAVTHRGPVLLSETVQKQCDRVFVLEDSFGLGHDLLVELLTGAVERGHDAVACPDPMAPERLAHLLLPGQKLAFVTSAPDLPYTGPAQRRLHLDSAADAALIRCSRPHLRFTQKIAAALEEEAVASLAQAKQMHDELEQLYNPHVDFQQVNTMADAITAEILSLLQ
jgi:hypothetical protein